MPFIALRRVMAAAFVLATVAIDAPAPVLAAGDATEGRRIARQWCSSCHIVGTEVRGPDAGPPFVVLANDPTRTERYLKTWISHPHPPMPNFNLSRQAVDDLVAYIRTLRERPRSLPGR